MTTKNKLKNYLKHGIFIFGILIVLTNCDNQIEIFDNQISHETKNIHKIDLDNYPDLSNYLNNNKLPKNFEPNINGLLKNTNPSNEFYSIQSYTDVNGIESYKLQFITDINYKTPTFYDLIIKQTPNTNEQYKSVFIKYKPSVKNLIENDFKISPLNYTGTVQIVDVNSNMTDEITFDGGNVISSTIGCMPIATYTLTCSIDNGTPHNASCYGWVISWDCAYGSIGIIPPSEGPILGGGSSGGAPTPEQVAVMQEYFNNISNCMELNNLLQTDNANIKPDLENLKTQINTTGEVGVSLQKNNGTYSNPALASTNGLGIVTPVLNIVYGVIHTHPTLISYPMFTWTDVNSMRRMYTKTDADNRPEVTIMLVSQKYPELPKVYALKINDFLAFRTQLNRDEAKVRTELELNSNNPNYYDDLYDRLNKKFGKKFKTTNDYEQAFLESFEGHDISLYKANDEANSYFDAL